VKKFLPPPTFIVVREPGDDERGQHRREKTATEDSTLSPQKEAGCFFSPDPWKENCLMIPSELPSGSRTGEGHGMLLQAGQFGTSKIFSQLQGGEGGFSGFVGRASGHKPFPKVETHATGFIRLEHFLPYPKKGRRRSLRKEVREGLSISAE